MLHPTALTSAFQPALWRTFPVMAMMFAGGVISHAQAKNTETVKNIVLVHGGFVDGSGWESVYNILTKKGYHVTAVEIPPPSASRMTLQ